MPCIGRITPGSLGKLACLYHTKLPNCGPRQTLHKGVALLMSLSPSATSGPRKCLPSRWVSVCFLTSHNFSYAFIYYDTGGAFPACSYTGTCLFIIPFTMRTSDHLEHSIIDSFSERILYGYLFSFFFYTDLPLVNSQGGKALGHEDQTSTETAAIAYVVSRACCT